MKITIETIPHEQHRYKTCGDWTWVGNPYRDDFELTIRVSEMGDWHFEAAVAVHELVEALLCKEAGISQESIDLFDREFAAEGEPGDHPAAPYHRQHCFATAVERLFIAALGVPWDDYNRAVDGL